MERRNGRPVKNTKGFIALTRKQKSDFFSRHLTMENKGRISKAVDETIITNNEVCGGFVFEDNRLSVELEENQYERNVLEYISAIEFLAKAMREGKNFEEVFSSAPEKVFGANLGLSLFGQITDGEELYLLALEVDQRLEFQATWQMIQMMAEAGYIPEMREVLEQSIDGTNIDRQPYKEAYLYLLEKCFGRECVETKYGRLSMLERLQHRYLMEFHTHTHPFGFSDSDMGHVEDSGKPLVVLSRSMEDMHNIDMMLAEPSENGAVDLGRIYSFPSTAEITAELMKALVAGVELLVRSLEKSEGR